MSVIGLFVAVLLVTYAVAENGFGTSRPHRRQVFFGSMDALLRTGPDTMTYASDSNYGRRRPELPYDDGTMLEVAKRKARTHDDDIEKQQVKSNSGGSSSRLWPPWPFNLITQRGSERSDSERDGAYQSSASIFWAYFRQRLRITKRQLQHVGSELWFHLPPAAAPLILFSCIPLPKTMPNAAAGSELLVKSAPTLFVNGFVRNLVLASLGVAILSWSNAEVNRNRRLTPLPLPDQYRDIYQAILPHFLPEEVPDVDIEILRSMEQQVDDVPEDAKVTEPETEGLSPRLRRHLQNIYQVAEQKPRTIRTTIREWKRMKELRRLEEAKVRRAGIMDELIALQALKKKAMERAKGSHRPSTEMGKPKELGYALVTGASRGIGRALAVELARWEIPLILVARDVKRLTSLANDIELCYGVKCYVLEADLSDLQAAERIHRTTKEAGLNVDVLVNNAGVCSSGLSVDIPNDEVDRMLRVNGISVAMLNQLYGKDMKENRRGRILVVSSIVGSVEAGPTVAVYAATKAFERSLTMSMGKELEPYGVGVTCLLPGAVRDTAFRSSSGEADEALCWKVPFYPRPAPLVAHQGVVGLLEGAVQVVPGWQNRAFLKVFKPILPQRITTMIVQRAWSPFHFSWPRPRFPTLPMVKNGNAKREKVNEPLARDPVDMPSLWPGSKPKTPPRMLKLPEERPEEQGGPLSVDNLRDIDKDIQLDDATRMSPSEHANIHGQGETAVREKTEQKTQESQEAAKEKCLDADGTLEGDASAE